MSDTCHHGILLAAWCHECDSTSGEHIVCDLCERPITDPNTHYCSEHGRRHPECVRCEAGCVDEWVAEEER